MLRESLSILKRDKVILLCSLAPILIGVLLYYFLGSWLYHDVMQEGTKYLQETTSSWAGPLSYILGGLLVIGFYFLLNCTLVLVVSLIAAPVNDLISSRTEAIKRSLPLPTASESIKASLKKLSSIIVNELKKVCFILFLSFLAFGFSFIFPPLGFLFSAILVAVSFLDYSWSRHELTLKKCIVNYKNGIIRYSIGGGIFTLLFGIPILNLLSYPVAVIYFTLHYVKTDEKLEAVK